MPQNPSDISPDQRRRNAMTYLIRATLVAISLATITPVANAAPASDTHAVVQQDWSNG